jgi:hypothetical protein
MPPSALIFRVEPSEPSGRQQCLPEGFTALGMRLMYAKFRISECPAILLCRLAEWRLRYVNRPSAHTSDGLML